MFQVLRGRLASYKAHHGKSELMGCNVGQSAVGMAERPYFVRNTLTRYHANGAFGMGKAQKQPGLGIGWFQLFGGITTIKFGVGKELNRLQTFSAAGLQPKPDS